MSRIGNRKIVIPEGVTVTVENNVVTVEPGIYLENEFGVRIEDMIVATDDGCIDLTKSPKELIIM